MAAAMDEDTKKKSKSILTSWSETRKQRLQKIKESKERPQAPLFEELQERPTLKELKTRKLVIKD